MRFPPTFAVSAFAAIIIAACSSSSVESLSDAGHRDVAEPHDTGAHDGAHDTGTRHDSGAATGLTPGECRVQSDCGTGGVGCLGVPLPASCDGACQNFVHGTSCTTDADCADGGAESICDTPPCNCPHGGAQAVPICTKGCAADGDCAAGESCSATHHCRATTCAKASDCPTNVDCKGGACAAKSCASDSDCPGAYCVENATGWQSLNPTARSCLPTPGQCTPYTA